MPTTPQSTDHSPRDLDEKEYDVVVLGGGSTGQNVADYATRGRLTAVVVESELVGGECSYWACMPSKALLRPGRALATARTVEGAGQAIAGELDVQAVLARRDGFTSDWDDARQVRWLEGIGVPLVRGVGRVTGVREVQVTGHEGDTAVLRARRAVAICTGSSPKLPPIEGLDTVGAWTSRQATSARAAPRRLLVLGGGVVGVEMATAWASLGTQVTLLERGERLLEAHEREAGELVGRALRDSGVDVRLGFDAQLAHRGEDGTVVLSSADKRTLRGEELLVATGRAPRTHDLGLEAIGLEPDGALATDDTMLVRGVEGGWLYAAGDVTDRAPLTHQGKYQARACGQSIAARAQRTDAAASPPAAWTRFTATADDAAVPQVVFTDPRVASVGLTEPRARRRGVRIWTAEYDLARVAGASLSSDDYTGWAKLVVDADRRVAIGATFVGPDVAELLHSATVAIVGEVPVDRLWHAVPSFPTVSEVWLRLLEQLVGQIGWEV